MENDVRAVLEKFDGLNCSYGMGRNLYDNMEAQKIFTVIEFGLCKFGEFRIWEKNS